MDKPAQWALVGAAWFLALTVAATAFLAWRHFESRPDAAAMAKLGAETALAPGATALCPVTHETLSITPQTPFVVYRDRVYYFSTTPDAAGVAPKRRFLMDPESFLNPPAPPAGQAPPAGAVPLPSPTVRP